MIYVANNGKSEVFRKKGLSKKRRRDGLVRMVESFFFYDNKDSRFLS